MNITGRHLTNELSHVRSMSSQYWIENFLTAGNWNRSGLRIESVDKKELARGIEIEMEHTSDPVISLRIALDHLSEYPDYYTALDRMERELEKKHKRGR